MIKVVLADDHATLRDGLKVILEMEPNIEIIGEASNGREAVDQVSRLEPDVVVMDISMPELTGIEATRKITQNCPNTGIIILSMHSTAEHVFQALQAGARGYLLKDSASRDVVDAVLTVASGKRYLSEPVTNTLVTDYLQQHDALQEKSVLESLSQREREILPLVLEGKSSVEIGKLLFLSPKSVETYRSRIMHKLEVKDMISLVKFAVQHNLMPK
ncbi:MAG: response regulator transcription factor [Chloroflexota bacterium]|nr:MAG: response regulator transcription factor [Chloroflexota bacterium]